MTTVLLATHDAQRIRDWLSLEAKRQSPEGRKKLRKALWTPGLARAASDDLLIERAVAFFGRELLSEKKRRDAVLTAWAYKRRSHGALRELLEREDAVEREDVIRRPWTAAFARRALDRLGLSESLAHSVPGRRQEPALTFAREPLELLDYQQENANRVELLCDEVAPARMMLYLPTGAGKTRTACQGLVQRMERGALSGRLLLWVSHTEELLEQALGTFRDLWAERRVQSDAFPGEDPSEFRVWRCWGSGLDRLDAAMRQVEEGGAAGIAFTTNLSLRSWLLTDQGNLGLRNRDRLVDVCWTIVIDEAHRSAAKTYRTLINNVPSVPVLGLSATPFRSCDKETRRLRRLFRNNLSTITTDAPDLAFESVERNLEERGILAQVRHETWRSTARVAGLDDYDDLPQADATRLSRDGRRNSVIIDRILQQSEGTKALVFAIDTAHAREIAMKLRRQGNRAFAVLGSTPLSLRRIAIEDFKGGRLDTLVSVLVLTQGFDAPGTDLIVLARPTFSPVLFQQILGRGRRGPAFDGTESMTFAYVKDCYTRGSEAAKRWRLVRQVLRPRTR